MGRRIDWKKYDPMLGTFSDSEIAAIAGCTVAAVSLHRQRNGVAKRPRITWTDESLAMIGVIPDGALAEQLRVSIWAVAKKRKSLGIAPCRKRRRWQKTVIPKKGPGRKKDATTVSVSLTYSEVNRLRDTAGQRGCTISMLIRQSLRDSGLL